MSETISAYPLQWPVGWNRIPEEMRTRARFSKKDHRGWGGKSLSVSDALDRVMTVLERMGVDSHNDVVINSDLMLRLDGFPRSGQAEPEDPGICVYWLEASGERRCMAIDRYDRVADNIAACAATLEAMRAIERHGGAEILNRAFTGFTALPDLSEEPWWSVLGYSSADDALDNDFEAGAKVTMQHLHPDKGGDDWAFNRVVRARKEGRIALRERGAQ